VSSGLQAVTEATAAVLVQGRRAGSAVLVDDRHLLTAEHVLRHFDGRSTELLDEVDLVFPAVAAGDAGAQPHVSALRLPLEAVGDHVDAAVLEIADPLPKWLPKPVPLWPAERLPAHLRVLGFPKAENVLRGVWREFATSGPAAGGAVQLDWEEAVGTMPGHSGGPVVDPATGALVGVLVEGSEQGRFDRFLPLSTVHRRWPDLPRPWLIPGQEGRSHFARRSRGQRSRTRGGDLFRGRQAALVAVRQWLTASDPPGQPLVITGQPGAGKSAVIARAAFDLERCRAGQGLAFHCREATVASFVSAVADLTGLDGVDSPDELFDLLEDMSRDKPWLIVLDALDEAATEHDRRQIAATLSDLAALPTFRIAVATRPLAVGDRYLLGELLPALTVTSPSSANLVDLDTDRFFEPTGLEEFAAALLAQEDAAHPSPPGGAWTGYRADAGMCRRLAGVIAGRADRNYLIAAMAAAPLSAAPVTIDPAAADFDPSGIPSGVGEALDKYLDSLPPATVVRTRGLLTALAYARGDGIDDRTWLRFAAALGYPAAIVDLDELRDSTAADYLLQTAVIGAAPATRLFHQALTDQLLAARQPRGSADQQAVLDALLDEVREDGGWATASTYSITHAAEHAFGADQLARLIDDAEFLAVADLARLVPLVRMATEVATTPTAVILRQVGARAAPLPPSRRTRLLALAAAHLGLRSRGEQTGGGTEDFSPRWAHSLGEAHEELTGHAGAVYAVTLGRIGKRAVVVSGGSDGTVRIWDPLAGTQLGPPLIGHTGGVYAVVTGRIAERQVVVSGGSDSTVRIWDCLTGKPACSPLIGHSGPVRTVALDRIGDDPIIVSGSDDGTLRMWNAVDGQCVGSPLTGYIGPIRAVALHRIGEQQVIVCCSGQGVSQVWEAVHAQPLTAPFAGYPGGLYAAVAGRVGGRELMASGGSDGTVRLWDPLHGQPIGSAFRRHKGPVRAVALGQIARRDVVVSAGIDGAVQIWDIGRARPLGQALTGHIGPVAAVAVSGAGEEEMIVSGGSDGTVRIWDTPGAQTAGTRVAGHAGTVNGVVLAQIEDQEVVVSGSDDGTVRMWDSASGRQRVALSASRTGGVNAVAVGQIDNRGVVACGGRDGSVRMWDLADGRQWDDVLFGHAGGVRAVAVGRVGDHDVVVSGGGDGSLRIWNPLAGRQSVLSLTGHAGGVRAVAVGRIGNQDLILSGGDDGLVRVWDAMSRAPLGAPLVSHTGRVYWVRAVAFGYVGDRSVVVAGVDDGTVRIWNAADWQPGSPPLTGHARAVTALAVARMRDRDLIVSGSLDGTVRIWDHDGSTVAVLDLLGAVGSVDLSTEGTLCATTGNAICVFGPTLQAR
jgi:WD40 repeat protein